MDLDTSKAAKNLLKEALELKQKGDVDSAKDSMARALSNDPSNVEIYYQLGKLEFTRGQYGSSINAYLGYVHLQLQYREAQLKGDIPFESGQAEAVEKFYNLLPDEAKNSLPRKSAAYILEDNDICNHIAHSYIASQEPDDENILNNLRLYYSTLVSSQLVDITLERFSITMEDFNRLNQELFIPQGRMVLLENIKWDNMDNNDILEMYFK